LCHSKILDRDPQLHFALLRLQLVELIRNCTTTTADISPALKFATQQLAPRASTSKEFLLDLERTMALLVFSPDNLNPQNAELLKPSLRMDVADRVNQAILRRQGMSVEAKIKEWVRARAWSEMEARRTKKDVPHSIKLGLDGEDVDGGDGSDVDEAMNGNGEGDAMIS
jgi:glucose-induced degradation protein 8